MDQVRSEQSRRTREELIAVATPQSELLGPPADAEPADSDDSLALLFGCCHPDLSSPSQIALTLRAVGGLSTAQIAAAFGVPEATMAQRISRAKQTISDTGFDFGPRPARPGTVRTRLLVAESSHFSQAARGLALHIHLGILYGPSAPLIHGHFFRQRLPGAKSQYVIGTSWSYWVRFAWPRRGCRAPVWVMG